MKIAGVTRRGQKFNARANAVVARRTWICEVCSRIIPNGSTYYLVNAFSEHRVCRSCGDDALASTHELRQKEPPMT